MYSRKAFERLGFQVASEFLYSDYEVEGEKVFETIKNHRGTAFMTKQLSEVGFKNALFSFHCYYMFLCFP